ncbi:unnamed protein product [Coregonus sp. 'balchen']|nr:unnamed protein product [Coregonus sp. 'balchen']
MVPLYTGSCANPEDPYLVVFHPVVADARVHFPSHVKRFEVQMFSFTKEADDPSGRVFVHCDVAICDASSPSGGPCSGQCVTQDNPKRGQRHVKDLFEEHNLNVSSGYILWV